MKYLVKVHERLLKFNCCLRPYHVENTGSRPITAVRHGPFDIQGGGRGAWVFGPGQDIFSDKIGARLFFSPALRAGLFFFITKRYIYNI